MVAFPAWSNSQISAKKKWHSFASSPSADPVAYICLSRPWEPGHALAGGSALSCQGLGQPQGCHLLCLCFGLVPLTCLPRASWLVCAFFPLPSLLCCLLSGLELFCCLLFLQLSKWAEIVEPTTKLCQLWSLGSYNLNTARKSLSSSFADGA